MVSDSRIQGWLPSRYHGWSIRTVSRPGGRLADLFDTVTDHLRPVTRVLVIMGLHCDLTFLTNYSEEHPKGLMRLLPEPPLADIYNVITSKDREWRLHGALQVAWILPYIPNFDLFNHRRARLLKLGNLGPLHAEEAEWSARQMAVHIEQLAVKLRQQRLVIIDMAPWVPLLTADNGSDGVHLGVEMKHRVFAQVVEESLRLTAVHRPLMTSRTLSVADRWALRLRRQRHRRNRRARTHFGPSRSMDMVGSDFIRASVAHQASFRGHPMCDRYRQ